MLEVPTPAWIPSRQLTGPTFLVARIPARDAFLLTGLLFVAAAVLGLVSGRPDMFVGILVVGALVTAAIAFGFSRFRFLASDTWLAAEYVGLKRVVRLDDLVKATVSIGSWTYLRLSDSHGGYISIQVATTLPRIRPQVVRGIVQGLERGMRIDDRTAKTLGLKIWRSDLKDA